MSDSRALTKEVLLCTYNGEKYIEQQFWSIVGQETGVDRLSVFDDGSSDRTIPLLHELASASSVPNGLSVSISVNERRLGFSQNFANAIENSSGDLLFLCDQDDVWEPCKVSRLESALQDAKADLVFSDGVLIDSCGSMIGRRTVLQSYGFSSRDFAADPFGYLARRNFVNGAAIAIRRAAALSAMPVPLGVPHDYWLALWCAARHRIAVVMDPLYRYRQHDSNVIGISAGSWLSQLKSAWRHPFAPRRREFENWSLICKALFAHGIDPLPKAAKDKEVWMTERFTHSTRGRLACWIAQSVLDGSYRRLSVGNSALRDLAALFRGEGR